MGCGNTVRVSVRLCGWIAVDRNAETGQIVTIEVPRGTTLSQLKAAYLGMDPTTRLVVIRNDRVVEGDFSLEDGDAIRLFPPLVGG